MLDMRATIHPPVTISSIELLNVDNRYFVRTRSKDGAVGIASATDRVIYCAPILKQLVAPHFIRKDARDIGSLIDSVYLTKNNYQLAGVPLGIAVACVEMSIFDLLGKIANKSIGGMLGGVTRREIPVYLSSPRRDTTPEAEIETMNRRVAETQAKAVMLKIGGRMGSNTDASPGRTGSLVALARNTWGDGMTIYVDANGAYDVQTATQVGKILESYGVKMFEEPCPFDEYEQTKQVADALEMAVAGGKQDTSIARYRWMIKNRGVDVVQPDLFGNGGFIRSLRIARSAQNGSISCTLHSPYADPNAAYMLHFASVVPNIGPFQEYLAEPLTAPWWSAPSLQVQNGAIKVPTGPGLGVEYDPAIWKSAVRI
jgi:L-alanine-DL-glutamate epimerase-like enolase superfamily enzyme